MVTQYERRTAPTRTDWMAEHNIDGLRGTLIGPDTEVDWSEAARFRSGIWAELLKDGEVWFEAEVSGRRVYKQVGLTTVYHAPADLVERWERADWQKLAETAGPVRAAQAMLVTSVAFPPGTNSNVAYLLEVDGVEPYIEMVRGEEWLIAPIPDDPWVVDMCVRAAEKYGLPYARLVAAGPADSRYVRVALPGCQDDSVWLHPESRRLFVRTPSGQVLDTGLLSVAIPGNVSALHVGPGD